MEVNQIYKLINSVSSEVLGKTDFVHEDLTGIVDLGNVIYSSQWRRGHKRPLTKGIQRNNKTECNYFY